LLERAGVKTDGASLVEFLRSRTLSAAEQELLAVRVRELGSPSFAERERASSDLAGARRFALPLLRPAILSSDLEVARRASRCIEEIERSSEPQLLASAARLVAAARPAGAAAALVGALPSVNDEATEETMYVALTAVGLKDGVAASEVVRAASSKNSVTRRAAGFVIGQANPAQRETAIQLLNDTDPDVRFRSALGLLRSSERSAMPALIALLDEAPLNLAWRAEGVLERLYGERDLPDALGPDTPSRRRARQAWDKWWRTVDGRVDFGRLTREDVDLGLNLIVEINAPTKAGGSIREATRDGKVRWEIGNVVRPIDARVLPNGHVLVAEHGGPRVSERLRDGTIIWEYHPAGQPVSCQRLANGNTFIATYNELLEVNPAKEVVSSLPMPTDMVFCARRLPNGNSVYLSSNNRVVELDGNGAEVRSIRSEISGGWGGIEVLANGRLLVALSGANKIIEVDEAGNVRWRCTAPGGPAHAIRLKNGNTLVASIAGRALMEFDSTGKQVWRQDTPGKPFKVYRR
jgi:hypothetical protein